SKGKTGFFISSTSRVTSRGRRWRAAARKAASRRRSPSSASRKKKDICISSTNRETFPGQRWSADKHHQDLKKPPPCFVAGAFLFSYQDVRISSQEARLIVALDSRMLFEILE